MDAHLLHLKGCLDDIKTLWTSVKKPQAFGGKIQSIKLEKVLKL